GSLAASIMSWSSSCFEPTRRCRHTAVTPSCSATLGSVAASRPPSSASLTAVLTTVSTSSVDLRPSLWGAEGSRQRRLKTAGTELSFMRAILPRARRNSYRSVSVRHIVYVIMFQDVELPDRLSLHGRPGPRRRRAPGIRPVGDLRRQHRLHGVGLPGPPGRGPVVLLIGRRCRPFPRGGLVLDEVLPPVLIPVRLQLRAADGGRRARGRGFRPAHAAPGGGALRARGGTHRAAVRRRCADHLRGGVSRAPR